MLAGVLMLFVTACSDSKEGLVQQIQQEKDSFNLARNWESFYITLKQDIEANGKPITADKRFLEQVPPYVLQNNKLDSMKTAWMLKKIRAQERIDSLEMELKKY